MVLNLRNWVSLVEGDCLEVLRRIPKGSVDMLLVDLPYGTTSCKWDSVIPLENLWNIYEYIVKPAGAFVFTSAQPFTTALITSNLKNFAYCWYWNKKTITGFANAKKQPLRCVEDIPVFYRKPPTYNPQGLVLLEKSRKNSPTQGGAILRGTPEGGAGRGGLRTGGQEYIQGYTGYPRQVLDFPRDAKTIHPTQKPLALMEYMIRTYTNPGEVVLDNCMGTGTTGVACVNLGRKFIGIEKDSEYFAIAEQRIADAKIEGGRHG